MTRRPSKRLFDSLRSRIGFKSIGPASPQAIQRPNRGRSTEALEVGGAAADSIARLWSAAPCHRRYAVIAPLPPAETGVAYATVQTYRASRWDLDVFSRFEDRRSYDDFARNSNHRGINFEVFDLSALSLAFERRTYGAIVIAIGNSPHNLFLVDEIARLARCGAPAPIYLHAHDPCLIDLWGFIARSQGRSQLSDMASVYSQRSFARFRFSRREALAAGCLGLSAVIGKAPLKGIIVNSKAAKALAERDLGLAKLRIPVLTGFHPVFAPLVRPMTGDCDGTRPFTVGAFGVPGEAKRTELIYRAIQHLNRRGMPSRLMLAGYEVDAYLAADRRLRKDVVTGINAPSDVELQMLMNGIDVAVQLRRAALGESSGVVAQLLALGRPVVVTGHGSFLEYGDAVVTVDPQVTASSLADAILHAQRTCNELRRRAAEYCASRSPAEFMAWLDAATAPDRTDRSMPPPAPTGEVA